MLARCAVALVAVLLASSAASAQILANPPISGPSNSFVSPPPQPGGVILAVPRYQPLVYNTYAKNAVTVKGIVEPRKLDPATIRTLGFKGSAYLEGLEAAPVPTLPSGPGLIPSTIAPSTFTPSVVAPSSIAPSTITPSSITPSRLNIRR